jgi:MFS family permease
MLTPQFMLLAAAMTLTVAGITTTSSVAVGHLVREGATPAFAAWILSLVALVATVAKGVAGRLCEMFRPSRVFAAGLALQCAGDIALSYGGSPFGAYAFACVFGVGWGWSYLAGCVLPLEYFGREVGSRVLSVRTGHTAGDAEQPEAESCRDLRPVQVRDHREQHHAQ